MLVFSERLLVVPESWHVAPYSDIRPVLLNLMWINSLVIEDLLITRPPFWTIHPVFCNNVVLRNTTVDTVGYGKVTSNACRCS